VISSGTLLAIPDTRRHPRTARHPFLGDLGVRSLVAAPVHCPAEHVVGSLVVLDRLPRIWTEDEKRVLADCAYLCSQTILLRAALWTLASIARSAAPTPSPA
jgi:GAF domain-containing protein